jgi:S-adenosylmethionine-diacylglycerol 3-amino-3-carboxypropyl transferase
MRDVLTDAAERRYDFIHLSNILDWLTQAEAAEMLRLTHRALKPGGLTIIRQLNSSLDLPALGPQLEWLADEADELHRRDRSFFYRKLHLGRRA